MSALAVTLSFPHIERKRKRDNKKGKGGFERYFFPSPPKRVQLSNLYSLHVSFVFFFFAAVNLGEHKRPCYFPSSLLPDPSPALRGREDFWGVWKMVFIASGCEDTHA